MAATPVDPFSARGTFETGAGPATLYRLRALDDAGVADTSLLPYSIRMVWKAHRECANPVFGVGLYRTDGTYLNGSNHQWREQPIELNRVIPGDEGEVEIFVERMPLQHGQYYLTLFLYDHSKASPTAIDHREHVLTFEVLDVDRAQHGMIQVPSRWTLTRRGPSGTSELESLR